MSVIENRREVAYRVFAAEFDDASLSYSEGDEERAPNYVVTPTGARVNRLFAVGALTEVESVNEEVLRGRIADPTGVFVTYAGQYQPEAMNFLDRSSPPMFVSLTGKARTYEPDDSDRVFTSVRPESINEVDAGTRDRWVVAAARATLERVATIDAALSMEHRGDDLRAALEARGVESSLATGVPLAIDHYGTTEHYLEAVRTLAVQALELVSGDRDSVETLSVAPDEAGPDELGPVPEVPAATPPEGGDVAITEARESGESVPEGVGDETEAVGTETTEAQTAEASAESDAEGTTATANAETTTTETATGTSDSTAEADSAESPSASPDTADPSSPSATADAASSDPSQTDAESPSDPEPTSEPAGERETAPEPDAPEPTSEGAAASSAETDARADADAVAADSGTPDPTDATAADAETAAAETDTAADADAASESPSGGLGDFDAGDADATQAESASDEPESGGLGDFDAGDSGAPQSESASDDDSSATDVASDTGAASADATTGEMYEMDDEERAEIEEEFGAEFSTGNEVDDPGKADIDTPDADELEAQAAEANAETNGEAPSGEPAATPDDARPDTQSAEAAAATSSDGTVADESETPDAADTAAGESVPTAEGSEPADDSVDDAAESAEDVDLEDAVIEAMAELDDGDGADRDAVVTTLVDRYGADADAVDDAIQDALMSGKCYEPSEGTLKSI